MTGGGFSHELFNINVMSVTVGAELAGACDCWALAQKLYHLGWFFLLLTLVRINPRPTLKPYSRFCRAGGNQGAFGFHFIHEMNYSSITYSQSVMTGGKREVGVWSWQDKRSYSVPFYENH